MATLRASSLLPIGTGPVRCPRTTHMHLPQRSGNGAKAVEQRQACWQRRCPIGKPIRNIALKVAASDDGASTLEGALRATSAVATTLFPVRVIAAAVLGFYRPEIFTWFTDEYVQNGLILVMAGMGLTLTFEEIGKVFTRQPALLGLGMVLQYSVLPAIGWLISRHWGPGLGTGQAIGIALVSCMPGGTASNIVAYIARGDMPLSVMMTSASTLMAVFMTPLLSSLLVGQLIPISAKGMFLSVLKLVLLPVLAGCTLNTLTPGLVRVVRPFMPLAATVVVVLIVGSMIASNTATMTLYAASSIPPVFVLHSMGFFLGYFLSKALGLSDKIARTNSIEVGMQSSALAAVLAKIHFPDQPAVLAACVMSACTHATIGSLLAGVWNFTVYNWDA